MSRVAIVTGSDSGIGKATAVHLAQAGCDVGVTFHDDEEGAAPRCATSDLCRDGPVRRHAAVDPRHGERSCHERAVRVRACAACRAGQSAIASPASVLKRCSQLAPWFRARKLAGSSLSATNRPYRKVSP